MPTAAPAKPRSPAVRNAAVERLVESHGAKVYALALRLCHNRSEAEEAVQDTFLNAARKWDQFEGRSEPSTWLYTIAVRACRRRQRRRKGQPRAMPSLETLAPFRDTTVADIRRSEALDPAAASQRREAVETLRGAIVRLPEPFRLAIVLKDMLELPTEDAAQVLGIKPETVKTRVHRARLMLRAAMMRAVPQRAAPEPTYDKQVCLDLLRAKLDAMDRGRGFPIGQNVVCERCRSVFAELDLTQSVCGAIAGGEMPPALRRLVLEGAAGRDRAHSGTRPRRRAPKRR